MGTKIKFAFRVLFIIIFLAALFNLELIVYGAVQGFGQVSILFKAKPIQEIYNDPNSPDSLVKKLEFIDSVRTYAVDILGLKESENYRSIYDQQGKPIMFVVTACKPYEFVPKTWKFPVVGEVPYKGYFNLDLAIRERDKLKAEGWDTSIRTAGAWSTLGWFKDPILSEMLKRSPGDLANLIIHELSHGTVFVKDEVTFNENLATFIGDRGAEQFLADYYGENSPELMDYLANQSDEKLYVQHILKAVEKLKELYTNLDRMDSLSKEKEKNLLIKSVVTEVDTLGLINIDNYKKIFKDKLPNNTYFMSFLRYQSNQDSLAAILKTSFDGNIKNFISSFNN